MAIQEGQLFFCVGEHFVLFDIRKDQAANFRELYREIHIFVYILREEEITGFDYAINPVFI